MQACQATENLGPVNKAVGSDTHLLEMEADLLDLRIPSCRRNPWGMCPLWEGPLESGSRCVGSEGQGQSSWLQYRWDFSQRNGGEKKQKQKPGVSSKKKNLETRAVNS